MRTTFAICAMLCVLAGCDQAVVSTSPDYMRSAGYQRREAATESLFASDDEALRGESIEKILSVKVVIPDKARLAILRLGPDTYWSRPSDDVARLDRDIEKDFIGQLRNCGRLSDASLLPSLMVPSRRTVPHLRLASARYQADLLLIYRSASRFHDKQRLIGSDEIKAQCTVEAILLDVRTGLVPFASVAAQEYVGKKSEKEFDFAETVARAEMKAVSTALGQVAGDLTRFLDGIP
jgi:hypothetical protein